jgi:hypothetical protein
MVEGTELRVLTRPRMSFPAMGEVRYPDIVGDKGRFLSEAKDRVSCARPASILAPADSPRIQPRKSGDTRQERDI